MLNSPPLKQTDTARAAKISGVAIARTYPMPSADPSEASKIDVYTSIGFSPYAMIRSDPASRAIPNEASNARNWPAKLSSHAGRVRADRDRRREALGGHYAASSGARPSMPIPICSGGASGGNSPVILPSYNVTIRSESA